MLNQTMLPVRITLIIAVLAILGVPLAPPVAFADHRGKPDLVVENATVDDDPHPREFSCWGESHHPRKRHQRWSGIGRKIASCVPHG